MWVSPIPGTLGFIEGTEVNSDGERILVFNRTETAPGDWRTGSL